MSETLGAAFQAAWAECENPPLDCTNTHFKNRYASLSATLGSVRAACRDHGLRYQQTLCRAEAGLELRSSVVAADGEALELSVLPVNEVPNPQTFGSELTYKKRQQAQLDWGIAGEEDDDGEAGASGTKPPGSVKPSAAEEAWKRLLKACAAYEKKAGIAPKSAVSGVKGRPDYPAADVPDAEKAAWFDAVASEFEAEL